MYDNCSGQNKNWVLFTIFCYLLNVNGFPESITIKYFEKGHTFISADSFHHQIEKEMRSKKNVCDFHDFEKIIESKVCKLPMTEGDFHDWENELSQRKFALSKPSLCNVQVVMFKKSETKMFWKQSYLQEEFRSCIFFLKKIETKIKLGKFPPSRRELRGITTSKTNDIVEKLLPLMPGNRHEFWRSLFVNSDSNDLVDNFL